jgi:hypothetical protein
MTDHKKIYAALAAAQSEMGKAIRDSTNPAFRSKYADLASVMAACLPALNKNGIAVFQPPYDDESGRYIETVFAHSSGDTIKCRVPLIIGKNDMQGYGSAATYARRYGLMGMAGIAPEDDDGNAAVIAAPKPVAPLTDAWKDGVLDSLPDNATPTQKAEAFAKAICADFAGKGDKALENRWAKHEPMIKSFADRYPELHGLVIDAYETRRNELQENAA